MEKESVSPIPLHLKPRSEEKGPLFKNKFMEKITRSPIEVPVAMHTCISIGFLYYSIVYVQISLVMVIILFLAGILSWTLAEYVVHRGVYHTKTNSKWWLKLQHAGHGIHHQYPRDRDRLAMPPLPAIFLITLFFGLFWLIGGVYAFAFFPGFLFGYVLYISFHYAQHRFKPPKFGPWKKLWKHHAFHHYKYPETKAFGVSTRLWDFVFGTMP